MKKKMQSPSSKSPKRSPRRSPPRGRSPRKSPPRPRGVPGKIVVMNENTRNQPTDVHEFHTKCLEDGFKMLPIHLWKQKLSDNEWIETQKNVKEIDSIANPPYKGKMPPKPFFRYIDVDSAGIFNARGGGLYLYSGWSESKESGANKIEEPSLRGKIPVYMRMKNAVAAASQKPNISIQWNKVVAIYYKPPEQPSSSVTFKGSNGTIVKLIEGN